ncbi:unnamed protein product [Mytilus coruscus]|uniref:Uncharacterized protein n=1 Tax=Mytilus coruscus TaxID=42192 RepID=A0A6J8AFG5_MYTCO|nr:unnamed protein product [Mytilus coruscus]
MLADSKTTEIISTAMETRTMKIASSTTESTMLTETTMEQNKTGSPTVTEKTNTSNDVIIAVVVAVLLIVLLIATIGGFLLFRYFKKKRAERKKKFSHVDLYINTAYVEDEFNYEKFVNDAIGDHDNYDDLNLRTSPSGSAATEIEQLDFNPRRSNVYDNLKKDKETNPYANTGTVQQDTNPYANSDVTNDRNIQRSKYPMMSSFKDDTV